MQNPGSDAMATAVAIIEPPPWVGSTLVEASTVPTEPPGRKQAGGGSNGRW